MLPCCISLNKSPDVYFLGTPAFTQVDLALLLTHSNLKKLVQGGINSRKYGVYCYVIIYIITGYAVNATSVSSGSASRQCGHVAQPLHQV